MRISLAWSRWEFACSPPAYQRAFKSHTGPGRVAIYDRPADCPDAVQLHHWTVCPVPEDFQ